MSSIEHYFENLLFEGYDVKNDLNKNSLSKEVQDAIETCATYIRYTVFNGDEELKKFLNAESGDGTYSKWVSEFENCSNCKFANDTNSNGLYHCLNTEINIKSYNTENFGCSKWEFNYDR